MKKDFKFARRDIQGNAIVGYLFLLFICVVVFALALEIVKFSGTGKFLLFIIGYYVILFGIPFMPIGAVWMLPTITGFRNLDIVISLLFTLAYLIFVFTYGLDKYRQIMTTSTPQKIMRALLYGPLIMTGVVFILALLWAIVSGVFGWLFST